MFEWLFPGPDDPRPSGRVLVRWVAVLGAVVLAVVAVRAVWPEADDSNSTEVVPLIDSVLGIANWVAEHADPEWTPPLTHVVALDSDNFTQFIQEQQLSLVQFYAPG